MECVLARPERGQIWGGDVIPVSQLSQEYKALCPASVAALQKRAKEANAAVEAGAAEPLGKRPRTSRLDPSPAGGEAPPSERASHGFALAIPTSTTDSLAALAERKRDLAKAARARLRESRSNEASAAAFSKPDRFGSNIGDAPGDCVGESVTKSREKFSYAPQREAAFDHLEWRNVDLEDRVKTVTVATGRNRKDVQHVHNRLSAMWTFLNSTVSHRESADVSSKDADAPTAKTRLCMDVGRCACGREGTRLESVFGSVRALLNTLFSTLNGRRSALTGCDVVVLFIGREMVDPESGAEPARPKLEWYLAAEVMLRPFVPMWRRMKVSEESSGWEFRQGEGGNCLANPRRCAFLGGFWRQRTALGRRYIIES